jgi:hypothetical protein
MSALTSVIIQLVNEFETILKTSCVLWISPRNPLYHDNVFIARVIITFHFIEKTQSKTFAIYTYYKKQKLINLSIKIKVQFWFFPQ